MKRSLPLDEQAGTVLWLSQLEAVLGICSLHFQKDMQLVLILNTIYSHSVSEKINNCKTKELGEDHATVS